MTQPFIEAIATRITRDLLEPEGLKVPRIPIYIGGQPEGAAGGTMYEPTGDHKPLHIALDPVLIDRPLDLVAVLAHEMIHSALPFEVQHGPEFVACMKAIGMEAPFDSAIPTQKFYDWYRWKLMPELNLEFDK